MVSGERTITVSGTAAANVPVVEAEQVVAQTLMPGEITPINLANTLAIQQYNGLKYTSDETDARFLAHLLRLNILPTGYIYPKAQRQVRDLLRRRLLLVKQH